MKKLFIPVLALALVLPLSAATPTAKPEEVGLSAERLRRVTELVQRHLDAKSFSGAVTLVARNGRIGHFEAQGLMDIESRKPMQKDAMFRIMSMTKPVVGVSILMLIEEGKVRLTDPISKWIPELKDMQVAVPQPAAAGAGAGRGGAPAAGGAPPPPRFYTVPAEREITVRDLLTHTSGLGSGTISNYTRRAVALKDKESLADFIPRLGKTVLEFQPGTRWAYSAQDGFDVLARVVEIVSGMGFDQFAKQRIFDPLGMKDTYFYPAGNPRAATNYTRQNGELRKVQGESNFINGRYFSGGGGLFSTAEDYLQFGLMLVNGGQLNGKRLLAPRTVELMGSIAAPDSLPGRQKGESFGLSVRVVNDPMARNSWLSEGSFGWSGAFGTHFWVDRKQNLVAVVMTQTSNQEFLRDFENMVMQAVVGNGVGAGTN
jgi:CubicO group peptidase (beta-lactamase class C family)